MITTFGRAGCAEAHGGINAAKTSAPTAAARCVPSVAGSRVRLAVSVGSWQMLLTNREPPNRESATKISLMAFEKACGTVLLSLVVITTITTATAAAQTRPDFSGRWSTPAPATASGVRGVSISTGTIGSGWTDDITITQDASRLTVERAQFSTYDIQPPMRLTYALDGSENRNTINMGRGPQEIRSRAVYRDGVLVITSSYPFTAPEGTRTQTIELKQELSLDTSGSLVVTTTLAALAGGSPSTAITIYKKNP